MNVLIVRTSAMGDIVHGLPVLTALRRGLPQARIAWVVERAFADLVADHPDLDAVVEVDLRAWRRRPFARPVGRQIAAAVRALRRFAPEVALDLMGNHKGALLARLSGARRIIGAARPWRREPASAPWINEPVAVGQGHAVDRALALVAPLGLRPEPVDFGGARLMTRPPSAAADFLAARRGPFVLIQPGAGWGNKTWPPARWGEVARGLRRATDCEVWVPTAPGEEELARAVVRASAGAAGIVDARSLPVLAALLRACRLLLGGDTGPLHLAHALGTRVLCLMGPTDPDRNGPWGAPDQVLWHRMPCSFCYKRYRGPRGCLLAIPPSEVVARACRILA